MTKKIIDNSLPKKSNAEDKIFSICDVWIKEFTQFITDISNIDRLIPKRYLSDDYSDLNIDHAYLMKNDEIVTIEHHTNITRDLMRRNFQYETTLHAATKKLIHPYIFNTGEIPKFKVEYASPTSFYNQVWVNTQEKDQSLVLNNIRYKIENNEEINVFDALHLIWLPKYRSNHPIEEIIIELIDIYNNIIVDEYLLQVIRKCLVLWSGKYLTEENIKIAQEGLNMTPEEAEVSREDIINARIDGMIYRAEEKGKEEGREEGREEGKELGKLETAKNMIENGFNIDVIVEITGLSENTIQNIQ